MVEATKSKTKTTPKKKEVKPLRYFEGVGGRKRASARVRIIEDKKEGENRILVNDRPFEKYFPSEVTRLIARDALQKVKSAGRFSVTARIEGGGTRAQAEALRHGTARALVVFNEEWRRKLKRAGYLKRDPRKVERKKFGKKKARKSPQWSKR